jgi:hypothetical protein
VARAHKSGAASAAAIEATDPIAAAIQVSRR